MVVEVGSVLLGALSTLLTGLGALLLVGGRSPRIVAILFSTSTVAFLWAVSGGLAPEYLWPVHAFEWAQLTLFGLFVFHWFNGIAAGLFGGGVYLHAEISSYLFGSDRPSGSRPGGQRMPLLMTIVALSVLILIALGFAASFWIILYTAIRSLVSMLTPLSTSSFQGIALSIVSTVVVGVILGSIAFFAIKLGETARSATISRATLIAVGMIVLGIVVGLAGSALALYNLSSH